MATADLVEPLSADDRLWLERAESHILSLLTSKLGDVSLSRGPNDLALVQQALDGAAVRRGDDLGQQCLGVVLGNVFDGSTEMKWAMVTNDYGRLMALHSSRLGFTLYPLQMIVKRVESGERFEVAALYQSFVHDLGLRPA
jgi:hypothetical protein